MRKVVRDVPPWRVSFCLMADSIVELPVGVIEGSNTQRGDELVFEGITRVRWHATVSPNSRPCVGGEQAGSRCEFLSRANAFAGILIMPQTMAPSISLAMLLLYTWTLFSFPAVAYGQQVQKIEWQDEKSFTGADRSAIPALASTMGLQNPRRVYQGQFLPSLCPFVMVESTYSESGHLRTYLKLRMYRKDWKCRKPGGAKIRRVGRWFAYSTDLETRREWRIEEDQWVRYVPFGNGVSYEDAELIILAIKHDQLVKRLPDDAVSFGVPAIDPADITSIQVRANEANTFEVGSSKGGSGKIYVIKIIGHSVELHEIQFWIA